MAASFEKAVEWLLQKEGGFVDDPQDPGGATNFGISTRWLRAIGMENVEARTLQREVAIELYRNYWWDHYHYGEIEDQLLATKMLEVGVLSGPEAAARIAQRALRAVGHTDVKEDGVLGPVTLTKLNGGRGTACAVACLQVAFLCEEAGWLRDLDKPRFEPGWVSRAYQRPPG